jgi:hypothetical protein
LGEAETLFRDEMSGERAKRFPRNSLRLLLVVVQ